MATISEALATAVQHHQAGRLQAAEEIYRQILAVDPDHADALVFQQRLSENLTQTRRYGDTGAWLHRLANGEDDRIVESDGEAKSISAETTFESDISARAELERILWDQAERVSRRAKASGLGGKTVTLKLKTASFKIKTRSFSLAHPTQLAHGHAACANDTGADPAAIRAARESAPAR
jgi:nucleotidyltransferase/DNA polymerase involved in DNA repair